MALRSCWNLINRLKVLHKHYLITIITDFKAIKNRRAKYKLVITIKNAIKNYLIAILIKLSLKTNQRD